MYTPTHVDIVYGLSSPHPVVLYCNKTICSSNNEFLLMAIAVIRSCGHVMSYVVK